jgi:hypothetical protein
VVFFVHVEVQIVPWKNSTRTPHHHGRPRAICALHGSYLWAHSKRAVIPS